MKDIKVKNLLWAYLVFFVLVLLAETKIARTQDKPVIRLEDLYIQGKVRRPPLTEVQASRLNEKVQEAALANLLRLEARLLTPRKLKPSK